MGPHSLVLGFRALEIRKKPGTLRPVALLLACSAVPGKGEAGHGYGPFMGTKVKVSDIPAFS